MSLREDMWRYEQITGESAEHVPIIKLGAFLDGYEMAIKALEQQPCEDATLKDIFCMGCEYKEQQPSADCISREEAIDRMRRKNMPVGEDNTKERFRYLQWLSDLETIKELPSVKPQRKKGRWIEQQDIHKHHYGWSFCSECGAFLISSDGANFCSCCGAKMEVDE